jgi:hypothetical protein
VAYFSPSSSNISITLQGIAKHMVISPNYFMINFIILYFTIIIYLKYLIITATDIQLVVDVDK